MVASVHPLTRDNAAMVNADSGAMSRGKFPGARFDLHRYRALFPDRWADLLRRHMNGDALAVQVMFGVSERQARDWLAGKNAPSGPFVAIACQRIPGALEPLAGAA